MDMSTVKFLRQCHSESESVFHHMGRLWVGQSSSMKPKGYFHLVNPKVCVNGSINLKLVVRRDETTSACTASVADDAKTKTNRYFGALSKHSRRTVEQQFAKMLSILRKARLKDKEMRILMLWVLRTST
jgi:hypothetical protein